LQLHYVRSKTSISVPRTKQGMTTRPTTIYLDTMLWNELCDQRVDPENFNAALTAKGGALVFSEHRLRTGKDVHNWEA
jgi:hypothetical protein